MICIFELRALLKKKTKKPDLHIFSLRSSNLAVLAILWQITSMSAPSAMPFHPPRMWTASMWSTWGACAWISPLCFQLHPGASGKSLNVQVTLLTLPWGCLPLEVCLCNCWPTVPLSSIRYSHDGEECRRGRTVQECGNAHRNVTSHRRPPWEARRLVTGRVGRWCAQKSECFEWAFYWMSSLLQVMPRSPFPTVTLQKSNFANTLKSLTLLWLLQVCVIMILRCLKLYNLCKSHCTILFCWQNFCFFSFCVDIRDSKPHNRWHDQRGRSGDWCWYKPSAGPSYWKEQTSRRRGLWR